MRKIANYFSILTMLGVVLMAFPGTSFAFASGQQASAPQQATSANPVEQADTKLSPIVVQGQRPTLPVILMDIKQGLK